MHSSVGIYLFICILFIAKCPVGNQSNTVKEKREADVWDERKAARSENGVPLNMYVGVWHCDNERWPSSCPMNPGWPQPQESQLTHHRSVFFASCFVFVSLLTKAWTRYLQGLTTIGPLPALLASFFLSLAPVFGLLFLASFSA